jgi:uncharacterized membrane protein HdeD (DUF308 family)
MATTDIDADVIDEVSGAVRKNWGWLVVGGIALLFLGCWGLSMVGLGTMTIASVLYFGIMVIAGGVIVLIDAFQAGNWKAKVWAMLIGLMYIVCGVVMIMNPGASAVWFTLFIAGFLLVSGIFRIVIGLQLRKEVPGWGWTVLGGIASLVLAYIIYGQWPISGLWVIGMFVAIEMIMQGAHMVAIGMAARASSKALSST